MDPGEGRAWATPGLDFCVAFLMADPGKPPGIRTVSTGKRFMILARP